MGLGGETCIEWFVKKGSKAKHADVHTSDTLVATELRPGDMGTSGLSGGPAVYVWG